MRSTVFTAISVILILAALLIASVVLWYFFAPQTREIRHVLLISIDTCRCDHLGCYGYPLETTPNIDAIAGKGIIFEDAISPQPFTLPAHCTMLTGTIPPFHGVLDNSDYRLSESNSTLAELLKEKGFSTAAFVSSFVLDAQFGLGQGFDLYNDDFEETSTNMGINQCRGDQTTRDAVEWLDNHQDALFFCITLIRTSLMSRRNHLHRDSGMFRSLSICPCDLNRFCSTAMQVKSPTPTTVLDKSLTSSGNWICMIHL